MNPSLPPTRPAAAKAFSGRPPLEARGRGGAAGPAGCGRSGQAHARGVPLASQRRAGPGPGFGGCRLQAFLQTDAAMEWLGDTRRRGPAGRGVRGGAVRAGTAARLGRLPNLHAWTLV
jgi:hypothetical protein